MDECQHQGLIGTVMTPGLVEANTKQPGYGLRIADRIVACGLDRSLV